MAGPVATMDELVRRWTARSRFLSLLSGLFSVLALVLVLVGIYGAMSYAVAQRTREIGIRAAVGADRADILRMVLRPAFVLIAAGLAIGVAGGLFISRGISGLLVGVRPARVRRRPHSRAAARVNLALRRTSVGKSCTN